MKANELMIGDWVIHPYYKHPSKIEYFNGSRVRVEYEEVEAESLRPIPLTPEILEKNGFKKDNDKFTLIEGHTSFSLKYARSVFQWLGPLDFKYVHELQHALKLCGIEKEYKL